MKTIPYRPSNGSEGMDFQARFCDKCSKDDMENGGIECDILGRVLSFQKDDPEYPKEWVIDEFGPQDRYPFHTAKCTAFQGN